MSEPYGQYPQEPYPAYGQQPPATAPPADVRTAFNLWVANIVVGVIANLLLFMLPRDLIVPKDQIPPGLDPATINAIVLGALVFAVVIGLGVLVLQVLCMFKMRVGRNWARIVLTVLGGLALLYGLIGIGRTLEFLSAGAAGVVAGVLALGQLVIIAGAVFHMYRPAANAYFH